MGLSGEPDEDISYQKHQELCNELNMDRDSANLAWLSYSNIRQNYSLEVRIALSLNVLILFC